MLCISESHHTQYNQNDKHKLHEKDTIKHRTKQPIKWIGFQSDGEK